jgi:3'-phosphoadenosine 5'-phosphosulfate sulfotransferase (PAPS reductase)/FAD synthetase
MAERHVLGVSGGKDSAALAVHMRQVHPELNIEYFFTDTGEELPEVYEFLGRLEGYLGKPIAAAQPATRLRLLATRIQPLPTISPNKMVHADAQVEAI